MSVRRWSQDARLSFARLPGLTGGLGMGRVPEAPQQAIRDLWHGDPAIGARIMKGELHHRGAICPVSVVSVPAIVLHDSHAANGGAAGVVSPMLRAYAQGFTWLRDLRALNTDSARLRARALVAEWLQRPPNDATARSPDVIGARVAAWLMHYDFFAASADDGFRQRLMARVVIDGRSLMAVLPSGTHDHRTLTAFKGLLACAVALPEQGALLARYMRFITAELGREVLLDGCHAERSPYAHLVALRELAEMRALMQTGQIAPPLTLAAMLDRMAPVLRALRHGDGGLALFNGSQEEDPAHIDQVLMLAARGRAVAPSLSEGGFLRLQVGRSLLFVDAGPPAPPGYDTLAQAGTLSFELSIGRERLIVNCGASIASGWQEAMRSTAAHSTLAIGDRSSSDVVEAGGISRRPAHVEIDHKQSGEAHWLELSQDGYKPAFGAMHRRRLYLAEDGRDIRGEDFVEADRPCAFALRFHLHPDVEVSVDAEAGGVLLTLPSGGKWRMRLEGGTVTVEGEHLSRPRGAPARPADRRRGCRTGHRPGTGRAGRRTRRCTRRFRHAGRPGAGRPGGALGALQRGLIPLPVAALKILQVTNVDFSLRHFLLPLMRELRRRGHEVVGVCADGELLAEVRAEGFRVVALPMARSLRPGAQLRAFVALLRLVSRRASGLRARAHADQRPAGPPGGTALRREGDRLYLPRLPVQPARPAAPARPGARARMARRPHHRPLLHGLRRGGAGCAPAAHPSEAGRGRQRARPHDLPPRPGGARRDPWLPRCSGRPRGGDRGIRMVRHKGYPELLQAMRAVPEAELWVVGARLNSDHGEGLEPAFAAAAQPGAAGLQAAPARLPATSPRCWPHPTSSCCRAISRACRCR